MKMEKLQELLETEDVNDCISSQLAKVIGSTYNNFDNHRKETLEFFNALSREGKQRFLAVGSLAAVTLAHRYRFNGYEEWDKRKEDSVRFAYCNQDFFTNLLESLGISFQYKHEKLDPYSDMLFYDAVIFHTGIKIHNIELFLGSFIDIHSTLIQNFFKGFYEVVKCKYPKHNFGNFNFPMY